MFKTGKGQVKFAHKAALRYETIIASTVAIMSTKFAGHKGVLLSKEESRTWYIVLRQN